MKFNIKRYFQVLGISLAVVAAAAFICLGMNFDTGESLADDTNTATVDTGTGKINVLLMCTDMDGLRTDAIMLAQYNTETGTVNMLSIPRDTRMFVGNRYQKINAAHAYMTNGKIGGAEATVEAVTRITGIPINYYIDFSLDGVAHVINELGPIEFTIPDICGDGQGMVYDDPVQSLHIDLPPGTYGLNGSQAVWVMRFRHGNWDSDLNDGRGGYIGGYFDGDGSRMKLQQEFIKAVVDQKVNAGLVLKIPAIFKAISEEVKTNLTVKDVVKYSKYAADFSSDKITSYELPGHFDKYVLDGATQDVWEVDLEATRELVQTVFGYPADNLTIENPNLTDMYGDDFDSDDDGYIDYDESSGSSSGSSGYSYSSADSTDTDYSGNDSGNSSYSEQASYETNRDNESNDSDYDYDIYSGSGSLDGYDSESDYDDTDYSDEDYDESGYDDSDY